MRNIAEYPITMEEVQSALDTALQREGDDDRVGGIGGAALSYLAEFLEESVEFKAFLAEKASGVDRSPRFVKLPENEEEAEAIGQMFDWACDCTAGMVDILRTAMHKSPLNREQADHFATRALMFHASVLAVASARADFGPERKTMFLRGSSESFDLAIEVLDAYQDRNKDKN